MKNNKIPPVFIVIGLFIVISISIVIARTIIFKTNNPSSIKSSSNTFTNIHKKFPRWKTSQKQQKILPVNIPELSHNIIENKHNGSISLIIFTDHSNQSAREQESYIKSLLKGSNKYAVQITYKFMPANQDITDGGLFEQIAYRNGIYAKYKKYIHEKRGDLTSDDFINILEKSGLPLYNLRVIMRRDMGIMLKWLEADIKQAYYFEATDTPSFFLNGYRLGTPELPLSGINSYVSRLIAGSNIADDIAM